MALRSRASGGGFDRRISIWRANETDDGTATVLGDPEEIGARWARKVDISDGERMRAGENGQHLASRFTVRADALTRTVRGQDIIKYKGRDYHVVGTKEGDERDDVVEITTATRPDRWVLE